jgi:hypothetical protein
LPLPGHRFERRQAQPDANAKTVPHSDGQSQAGAESNAKSHPGHLAYTDDRSQPDSNGGGYEFTLSSSSGLRPNDRYFSGKAAKK